jgi:hypothetical protein
VLALGPTAPETAARRLPVQIVRENIMRTTRHPSPLPPNLVAVPSGSPLPPGPSGTRTLGSPLPPDPPAAPRGSARLPDGT